MSELNAIGVAVGGYGGYEGYGVGGGGYGENSARYTDISPDIIKMQRCCCEPCDLEQRPSPIRQKSFKDRFEKTQTKTIPEIEYEYIPEPSKSYFKRFLLFSGVTILGLFLEAAFSHFEVFEKIMNLLKVTFG